MTSGRRWAISSARAAERMSRRWKEKWLAGLDRASARLASEPVERSSTTSTAWRSARHECGGSDEGRSHDRAVDDRVAQDPHVGTEALAPDGARRGRPRPAAAEQVELGLQVEGGCAGVDPVVVGHRGEEATLLDDGREDLPLDGHGPARGDAVEDRGLEHVRAGVDGPAHRLL